MHPDHVGMAGWLSRKFGVPLYMTRLEYLMCRVVMADTGREAPPAALTYYRRAVWSEAAIESYQARFGNFGQHIHALPDSFRRLQDGQRLPVGAHEWQVITGAGHSPEHACLYSPVLKLLISGRRCHQHRREARAEPHHAVFFKNLRGGGGMHRRQQP